MQAGYAVRRRAAVVVVEGGRGGGGGIKNYNSFAQNGDGAEIAQQLARGGRIGSRVVFRLRPSSPTSLPRLVNLHD